ncbi:hypothetical protein PR048_013931 [Dryococelus australis]|uniref:DUF4817 domain-containing protein n=1 Tax=Dryococelus australis TaxID=614101 RepID=A0ABQ9HTK8_9NEOP|nr:hypothetical protein PR048_013931 [Dryococelus australis]
MERFTWAELTDSVQVYRETRGNSRVACRIYQERLPNRRGPHHIMSALVDQRLRARGSFTRADGRGRRRTVRTPAFEEDVLWRVESIAHRMRSSPETVWRVLHDQSLLRYHRQHVQVIGSRDFPQRLQFARW